MDQQQNTNGLTEKQSKGLELTFQRRHPNHQHVPEKVLSFTHNQANQNREEISPHDIRCQNGYYQRQEIKKNEEREC